ncbi:MAG: hypothetical protein IJ642_04455 [Oscillospiraceae bacterium]|nr:hypothetical protein [Oscillospiraceae bacterium]
MNYYKKLYEAAAMLLLYTEQMKDCSDAVIIERYIDDCLYDRTNHPKIGEIDALCILLSLERTNADISEYQLSLMEDAVNRINDAFISEHIRQEEREDFSSDLKSAQKMICYYQNALR